MSEPAFVGEEPGVTAPGDPLAEVLETFGRWLHLPDPGALLASLGAIAANRLDGDPVWLLLVGPPGGGKSELLTACATLPDSHPCATLTEAALLSGSPKRDHAGDSKGGLLRTIGDYGLIVAKDFGSVLSMNRDARALVLAALREVYDGSWTRHIGTDGGRTLTWKGKVGMLGGCTPSIDRAHGVMASMGERFVLYRLPPIDAREQARRALGHAGREKAMRRELAAAVATLFDRDLAEQPPLAGEEIERLITLAAFVVRCRSAVERDGQSREIELVPEPEAPTRLIVVLERLLAGLGAIGVDHDTAWKVATKAALDSVPALRLASLRELQASALPVETGSVGLALGYPTTTARRALQDLAAHGLATRESQGEGKSDRWSLSEFALGSLTAIDRETVPEMSSFTRRGDRREGQATTSADIPGTVQDLLEARLEALDDAEAERLTALGQELGL